MYFRESLEYGRVIAPAQAVGLVSAPLEAVNAYVKEDGQFDQPIGAFQAFQHTPRTQTTLATA